MDYHRNPHAPPPGLLIRDAGLLILRISVGLALIAFHAWDEGVRGWKHLWYKEGPWAWAAEVSERGFPLPEAVAATSVAVAMLGSVFLLTGLLCRLSSAVLLAGALCGLFLYGKVPEMAERLALYAAVYAVLLICGPGRFSLDALFTSKRLARR